MENRVHRQCERSGMAFTVREDLWYKPSAPEMPAKMFFIETDSFRWEVGLWRCEIEETGTALFYARTSDSSHAAYGMTVNEAVNDLMSIMLLEIKSSPQSVKKVSFDSIRYHIDPSDAQREKEKIGISRKSFFHRIIGL